MLTEDRVQKLRAFVDEWDKFLQGKTIILSTGRKVTIDFKKLINCNPFCSCQYQGVCMRDFTKIEITELSKRTKDPLQEIIMDDDCRINYELLDKLQLKGYEHE